MKKLLLSLSLALAFGSTQAQNVFNFGFDGTTANMLAAGWVQDNQSTTPSATRLWIIPTFAPATVTATSNGNPFQTQAYAVGQTTPAPNGQAGGANSFCYANYASTSSTLATGATISNWLITPEIMVQDGDIVSFYTRIGKYSATNTASFADNLQLRMSTNGAFTTNPSAGPTDLADFTELLVEINPNLNLTSYPATWTQYSYTVDQVGPTPVSVKFAFRYFVTDAGINGANSDIIGIDTFSVDRPLATSSFFKGNFSVSPNPASDVININKLGNDTMTVAQLTDINGRIVKTVNGEVAQINIGDLNAGVYLLKVTTAQGSGTTKIIKK